MFLYSRCKNNLIIKTNKFKIIVLLFCCTVVSCNKTFKIENSNEQSSLSSESAVIQVQANWIKQMGAGSFGANVDMTTGNDYGNKIVLDSDGNIIIAGNTNRNLYSSVVEFGNFGFILKLDSNGNFLWLTQLSDDLPQIQNSNFYNWLYDIKVDDDGYIYATGETQDHFFEDNNSTDDADIYVVKLDPDGQIVWGKQFGNPLIANSSAAKIQDYVQSIFPGYVIDFENSDSPSAISLDFLGNIYIVGKTYGNWIGTNGGSSDALLIKLDSLGDVIWVKQIGAEYNGVGDVNSTLLSQNLSSIVVDSDENIYSSMSTLSDFGEVKNLIDCVVLKFNKFGSLLWVKQLGAGAFGTNASSTAGLDYCDQIALDSNNNVYVAGKTSGNLNELSGGSDDVFVMKLTTDGNFEWLKHFGDHLSVGMGSNLNNTDGAEVATNIFIDTDDKIFIGGYSSKAIGEANDTSRQDAFIIKMSSDGSFDWVKHIGSGSVGQSLLDDGFNTDGDDILYGLVVDSDGNIFGTGATTGQLAEEAHGIDKDLFVFKMKKP